jgi:spore coat protein U-like protein
MPIRPLLQRLCLAVMLLLGAGSAQALCLPVLCSCSVSTTNVAFGSYNPLAFGNTDSTGSVRVSCGGVAGLLVPYKIDLSTGGAGNYAGRRMLRGAYTLNYNLYTDAAYTSLWGDGSAATLSVSGSILLDLLGLSPAQTHWVYGRLPGRQLSAAPGPYTDTISVTLTYY